MDHPNFKRYYFDANALFKYYRDEPGSLSIRRLVADSSPIKAGLEALAGSRGTSPAKASTPP